MIDNNKSHCHFTASYQLHESALVTVEGNWLPKAQTARGRHLWLSGYCRKLTIIANKVIQCLLAWKWVQNCWVHLCKISFFPATILATLPFSSWMWLHKNVAVAPYCRPSHNCIWWTDSFLSITDGIPWLHCSSTSFPPKDTCSFFCQGNKSNPCFWLVGTNVLMLITFSKRRVALQTIMRVDGGIRVLVFKSRRVAYLLSLVQSF
jgi:hypothetical protein